MPFPTGYSKSRDQTDQYCSIQVQGQYRNCQAFAYTAPVETIVRIEHHLQSKRSKGNIRNSSSLVCTQRASIRDLVRFIEGNSVYSSEYFAQFNRDTPYMPKPDRPSRVISALLKFTQLNSNTGEKLWLSRYRHTGASLYIYHRFYSKYYSAYHILKRKDTKKDPAVRGHYVIIIGYNNKLKYQMIRNSQGPGQGRNRYKGIRYS